MKHIVNAVQWINGNIFSKHNKTFRSSSHSLERHLSASKIILELILIHRINYLGVVVGLEGVGCKVALGVTIGVNPDVVPGDGLVAAHRDDRLGDPLPVSGKFT